jgi:mRNA interferase RelE/StbE
VQGSKVTRFAITLTDEARNDLGAITDTRTRKAVGRKIGSLQTEPDKRGERLGGDLKELYKVRAAGQRYRVLYKIGKLEGIVIVVVIGIRKAGSKADVYEVARRRLGKR